MIKIVRYTDDYKTRWDELVLRSRNGTFMFYRDYLDYHKDKYYDCSFLVTKKGKIEAILPGNIENNCYYSHQKLTFGGLISSENIYTKEIVEVFYLINEELKKLELQCFYYKPVPLVYHNIPAQEDIYALFLNRAEKIGCNISSAIFQTNKIRFRELRRRGIRRAKREGLQISESTDFSEFWRILNKNLMDKYNTKPVHSVQEIGVLYRRFPENIRLFTANYKEDIVAGVVLYLMRNLVHVQYIATNVEGRNKGALDLLFDYLINEEFNHVPVFDFGHSTERMGLLLNDNLIFQKEGFGGRGIVYETYKYIL